MAVGGVHDEDVRARPDELLGLARDVPVDPDRGGDPEPVLVVDGGGVEGRAQGRGAGERAHEASRGVHDRCDAAARGVEPVERLARVDGVGEGQRVGRHHLVHLGEPVDLGAVVLRDDADDPVVLDHFGNLVVDAYALRLLGYRTLAKARRGVEATEQSILKLFGSEAAQAATLDILEELGPEALDHTRPSASGYPLQIEAYTASWFEMYLRSFAGTIAGGTSQIQRNIVADRVLGLPR